MSQDLTQGQPISANSVWRSRRSSPPGRGAPCREHPSAPGDRRRGESGIRCLKSHGPSSRLWRREVLGQVLVHLEHCYLLLAEHRFQLVVRQDLAPVFRVLQLLLLDVVPDLADDLAARQRSASDHGGQLLRRLQRLLKRVGLLASWTCRFCLTAFFLRCLGGFGSFGLFWCFSFLSGFGFFRCLGRHGYLPNC